jgi:hypothetical protein
VPELRWHRQALPERRQRLGLASTTMGSTIGFCCRWLSSSAGQLGSC